MLLLKIADSADRLRAAPSVDDKLRARAAVYRCYLIEAVLDIENVVINISAALSDRFRNDDIAFRPSRIEFLVRWPPIGLDLTSAVVKHVSTICHSPPLSSRVHWDTQP